MLCQRCFGSGRYMGPGMMQKDCYCEEVSDVEPTAPKQVQIDKRSKAYREAISKIMQENDMSKNEAAKVFEEEFYKIA